jgi:serine/threonine-protein kinase
VLRGLATRPEDRWASLDELLAALSYAPARRRRRTPMVALAAVLLAAALALGIIRSRAGGDPCAGAGRALSGVWDEARIAAVKRAFLSSGAPNAETIFEDTRRILDVYARSWLDMQAQSCRATLERHEQPKELHELRSQCLSQRLGELAAYTDLLSSADAKLVERSPDASYALSPIADCADTTTLRTSSRGHGDGRGAGTPLGELEAGIARTRALEISGRYDEATRLIGELLHKVRQLHHRPLEAELLMVLATVQSHLSDPDAAVQAAFDSAVAAEAGNDDFQATRAWSYLIFLDSRAERYAEAHRAARIAEAILERTGHPLRAESIYYNDVGDLLDDEGKFAEAVVAFRRSLELDAKLGNADKRGMAMTYNNLGTSLLHQGLDEEGRQAEQRSVQLFEEALGKNHPNVAMALSNLGDAYLGLGRLADAEAVFERALVIDRKTFGLESEDACSDLSWLARVRVQQARFAEAAALAEQVLTIRGKLGHREESVDAFDELGMAQLGLGRVREAVGNLQKAVSLPESSPRRRAGMHFHLARALWAMGRHDEARTVATEARAAAAKVIADHGNTRELAEMDAWLAAAIAH